MRAISLCMALITSHASLVIASAQPATPDSRELRGQTITLDLKGVDILDVLKLLSQQSGLNFVAGRNVTGRVTIFAKDVDVWEAFERIVDANELAYEWQGRLVTVMTAKDYELLYGERFQERKQGAVLPLQFAKAGQVATVLNQLKSTLGSVVVDEASNTVILHDTPARLEELRHIVTQLDQPTETRVFNLNYAEVEKLKDKLQEFLTPGVGTVSVDARTNKVVVTDLREAVTRIAQVIQAFDEQEGEVLIEAKIVKVELTDEQSLGIDWQQAFGGIETRTRANFRVLGDILDTTGSPATGAALKFVSTPAGKTQLVIEALKKFGKVETISNPRIMVSNNQEAKILVGTKEAFVTVTTTVPATGSVVTSPQVQFVDVGTKLFVTPRIKRDGHVQLKIRPEVSTAKVETFQSNRIPIVTTTEAETNVLVKSGTTLVIGGLIDTKRERTQNQIPVLGDIPVLGAVFRNRVDTNRKTELVVFLTPQIISASGERVVDFSSVSSGEQLIEHVEQTENAVPVSYHAAVRDLLSTYFSRLFQANAWQAGLLTLSFDLAHDGRVIGEPHVESPQGDPFVQATQVVIKSIPFPPFPEGSTAQAVRVRLVVEYRP